MPLLQKLWMLRYDSHRAYGVKELVKVSPKMERFGDSVCHEEQHLKSDHRFLINGKRVDVHKLVLSSLGCVLRPGL